LPSNSSAGASSVAPICNDHIPAPHPVGVSNAVVPAGASTSTAAGQCNQPLVSPLSLDPDSNQEALSLACSGGKEEMVELLLSKGTIIEHRDKKGLTPLMLAATEGLPTQFLMVHPVRKVRKKVRKVRNLVKL